jgi:Protein of unknown function (DUF3224)
MSKAASNLIAALALLIAADCLGIAGFAYAQAASAAPRPTSKAKIMAFHASGTFEVKLSQQPLADSGADTTLGRMTIDKTFSGDLQGASKGEMLTAMTPVKGSAGYVAIERVSGTLQGRAGTFVLQHTGTMNRSAPQLSITVVPDSGTGELAGITGTLGIDIVDGKHFYRFDYALPAKE